ncbi:MAG: YcxB family protein [Clostridia bacterium]|nr:YcxB family protein [Clostridia bacterium]
MEIRAKCKFNKDSIRALAHLATFKKSDPKKTVIIRSTLCVVLLLVIIAELVVFEFDIIIPIVLIVVDILVIAIDCFMYFLLPRMQNKALAKMKNAQNEYVFCDNILKAFTKSDEYSGEAEIEYSLFVKVYETSKYLFFYQTNNQVFIVDKSTIEGGTVEEIRNKLSAFIKDKYILCKY